MSKIVQRGEPSASARGAFRRATARCLADARRAKVDRIRRARGMTQVALASAMGISQAQITKVEHQADLYVSTLRRFVEAMGGDRELVARFPDGEVVGVSLATR